jgi:hypothetical protein
MGRAHSCHQRCFGNTAATIFWKARRQLPKRRVTLSEGENDDTEIGCLHIDTSMAVAPL